ncbi:hypothetical protein [Sorangium sp. So ce861]
MSTEREIGVTIGDLGMSTPGDREGNRFSSEHGTAVKTLHFPE